MKKLSVALLVAGAAAVTGFIVSAVMKEKKKSSHTELFDDCITDPCTTNEDLDVVIPTEETAETPETAIESEENAAAASEEPDAAGEDTADTDGSAEGAVAGEETEEKEEE